MPDEQTIPTVTPPVGSTTSTAPLPPVEPTPAPKPVVETPAVQQMVTIPKDVLDRMMSFMETVPKQIERAVAGADRGQLFRYDLQNQAEVIRKVRISTIDGRIIVAWKMKDNDMIQDTQNRWHEKQTIEVVFEDFEKKVISYKPDWTQTVLKIEAEIVSRYTTPEGYHMMRVSLPAFGGKEPREFDIDEKFVN